MASEEGAKQQEKTTPALATGTEASEEELSVELTAPEGWKKMFTPQKSRAQRNEIFFVSPTGDEIKNKRQLGQYLKLHPGGPSLSSFDWGTGDTPRRSVRIRERTKAAQPAEDDRAKKRARKSSTKDTKSTKDDVEETAEPGNDNVGTETEQSPEVDINDSEAAKDGDAENTASDTGAANSSINKTVENPDISTAKKSDDDADMKEVKKPEGTLPAEMEDKLHESKEPSTVEPKEDASMADNGNITSDPPSDNIHKDEPVGSQPRISPVATES